MYKFDSEVFIAEMEELEGVEETPLDYEEFEIWQYKQTTERDLKNEGEDWYISREVSEFRGQQVETLYLTDEFGVTTLLNINEFTMEEFFGNNWIEYKGVEAYV